MSKKLRYMFCLTCFNVLVSAAVLADGTSVISVTVNANEVLRSNIPETLFNGHLVHHKASITSDIWDKRNNNNECTLRRGYSAEAFDEIMLYGVRYPGGSAAREWYDYNDPAGVSYLNSRGCDTSHGTLDTFWDVLGWSKEMNMRSYFIVPVVRFWPNKYGKAVEHAKNAVSLTKDAAEILDAPMPEYWDIGNEIYEPDHNSTTYAEFAGRIAEAIKEVDQNLKTVIGVKRGDISAAKKIANKLIQKGWWESVDGVTFHVLNAGKNSWGGNEIYEQAINMQNLFYGKEFLVTALSPSSHNGLMSANAFLGSYEQLIRAGTDHIVIWPTTHFNMKGRQFLPSQGLTPSGKLLQWLSVSGVGSDMVSVSENSGGQIKVLALKDGTSKLTVFLAGIDIEWNRIALTVNGFSGSSVYADRMTAGENGIEDDTLNLVRAWPSGSNPYYFGLNKHSEYEVVKLEIRQ